MKKLKRLSNKIFYSFYIFCLLLGIAVFASPVSAYGPKRPALYTMAKPADHVTFNSITDNPVVGDERDFVRVKEVGTEKYVNELEIQPGKTYEFYAAYHNNATDNLNASGKGMARNTRMRGVAPRNLKKGQKTAVSVEISADNAVPKSVWDEAYLIAKEDLVFKYVADSATIHTNYKDKFGNTVNGQKLKGFITKQGAHIGSSRLNGVLEGCSQYSGYVTFRLAVVKPTTPEPEKPQNQKVKITKEVSIDESSYQKEAEVKDDSGAKYRITIENPTNKDISNIKITDKLPNGMEIVKGSIRIDYGDGQPKSSETVNIDIEKLSPSKKVIITYNVTVGDIKCGENIFENIATAKYSDKDAMDFAKLRIKKECPVEADSTPPPMSQPEPSGVIPETGPTEIIIVAAIIVGLAGGIGYFVYSKKVLKKKMQKVMGEGDISPKQ